MIRKLRKSAKRLPALARFATGIWGLFLFGNSLVFGQGFSAAISGVVRDSSGAVVPDATVTARNTETALTRTTQTTASGVYSLPSLPVGPYELTVEKPGFRTQVRRGITLAVAQEVALNLTLEVGEVQQTVEVTGEAPLVNTTLSPTSGLITEGQIQDLPLNGRSFEELLTLNVGTVNNESNTSSNWSSFSVAGKRAETNRFTMNGVDLVADNATGLYNSPQGASGQLLGVDAVREYNVLSHTYGAEYGKRAGGQITVVTTSGTNELHGTAFEYLRNDKLDARNYFSPTEGAPPFKRNQFGGSLGGPIIRDKMFIFGNYEGFRERLAVDNVAVVPSLRARQGLLPDASGVFAPVPNLVPAMLPFVQHYWPEPNGDELLANGLPTGTAFHISNPARRTQEDFGLARFDYNLSGTDSVTANFTADEGERSSPPANRSPNFDSILIQDLYSLSVQETHIFSPTVLNVATFGYTGAMGEGANTSRAPIPKNLVFLSGEGRDNPGSITIGGGAVTNLASSMTPADGNNPHYNRRRNYSGASDLSVVKGRHTLRAGVWFMRVEQTAFSTSQNNAGTAAYPTLRAFLQDLPTQFVAVVNEAELNFWSTEAAWYFQDEIKLRPNLTLRLGLRDEMTTGWNETNGRASNYNFDQHGVILTHPYIGRSALIENNALALWQPRVGVAWDPTGTGSWAVRAGFGIHNDLQDNLSHRFTGNPPYTARVAFDAKPLLSIIPFPSDTPPPPSCSAESPLTQPACSIFAPGGLDPALHTPTIQQWSLEVERSLTQDLMFQVSYVGNQSYHLLTNLDMNTIPTVTCANSAGCLSGGLRPASQRVTVPQDTDYIPAGLRRPNPYVGSTQGWYYWGTGSYHALNLSLQKRSRGGLTFKTNYTWGKVLDLNNSLVGPTAQNQPSTILNRSNPELSRGIASYSLQHQFNSYVSYQLPFGQGKAFGGGATGWADKVISGWQLNSIFYAQGGFPITPLVGFNQAGSGDSRNPDVPNRNPDFRGKVILGEDGFKKTGRYFDPNAFLAPPTGTFGNVARGAFRGPGLVNLDLSLFKRIPINERWNLQFRAEAFNILNHANFDTPNSVVFESASVVNGVAVGRTSGSAGIITETSNRERQIQFALRLEF